MSPSEKSPDSIGFHWWVRRNPLYLLSAAAMALGARWLLVHPDAAAGDLALILATLGVLQLYECAVSAVLILLHRGRKSPEDLPSLMLVAVLFWTGPLAAAVEMTARHGSAGLGFAVAACLIALGELHVVRRSLNLDLTLWSRYAAAACLILLTAMPWFLRLPDGEKSTNEAALYLAWWILAAIAVLAIPGMRRRINHTRFSDDHLAAYRSLKFELLFLLLVAAASAAQLWGMNYAFYANARIFYAAPLTSACALVWFEYLAQRQIRSIPAWMLGAALPALGIIFARDGFHATFNVSGWPLVWRDPLLTFAALAAFVWWYGALRRGPACLLHAGAASAALALCRAFAGAPWNLESGEILHALSRISQDSRADLCLGASAYLLLIAWWRRGRWEVCAALATFWAGVSSLIYTRFDADGMFITLSFGWAWLATSHVVRPRTGLGFRLLPLLTLAIANFGYLMDDNLRWLAAGHAVAMVAILFTFGSIWNWTRYRAVAASYAAALLIIGGGRWTARNEHAKAISAIVSAFGLLGLGAWVSWRKAHWLERTAFLAPLRDVELAPNEPGNPDDG